MKTAISVPDDTFERVTRRAAELGITRSEFYARAALCYLAQLDEASLTARIDDALRFLPSPDDSAEVAVRAGRRLLLDDSDW